MKSKHRNVVKLTPPSRRFVQTGKFNYETAGSFTRPDASLAVRSSRCTGSFPNVVESAVFFTVFLNETTSHQILEFLVGTKAKHFFTAADCVASFQILVNNLKEIIKPEGLFIRKDSYQFVCYVIWYPS